MDAHGFGLDVLGIWWNLIAVAWVVSICVPTLGSNAKDAQPADLNATSTVQPFLAGDGMGLERHFPKSGDGNQILRWF